MGLFDGTSQKKLSAQQMQMEMEEAKIRAALYQQKQYEEKAEQKLRNMYNQAAQTGLTSPTNPNVIGAKLGRNYGPQTPIERFNPNNSEAYQVSLSHLVTMWQAKHGDVWVDVETPYDAKDFYSHAYNRLFENGLFERVEGWARLKENVEKLLADR